VVCPGNAFELANAVKEQKMPSSTSAPEPQSSLPQLSPLHNFGDLGTIVAHNAQRDPRRVAVKTVAGQSRTYAELDERTNRLANALRGLGLEHGDRVATWMGDVVEYVELYVAAAKAGLVMVPLNAGLTPPEAAFQIASTTPRALVYTPELEEKVAALPDLEQLRVLACVPTGTRSLGECLADVIDRGAPNRPAPPSGEDAFMICFTSGTTGSPKGAILTHRSVMNMAATQFIALRIPLYGINVQAISISFPATITAQIIPHMASGGTNVLAAAKWDSERVLDIIASERATHINVPVPVLAEFIAAARNRPSRLETLVAILTAGQRADPAVLAELAEVIGTRYLEGWGMTEIGGGLATATSPGDPVDPDRPTDFFASCGRGAPRTIVRAVNEKREPLPMGRAAVGELAVRCTSAFTGYWQDPAATAKAMDDGWYYTGDVGSIDEQGYVYISDRRTNMIVSGGINIYPAELELVLETCPGVEEVAVVGAPHERWGQTPVAVVVKERGASLDEQSVLDYSRNHLASYKKPTRIVFVDSLPRTTGHKIARAKLRELVAPLLQQQINTEATEGRST
jgi:acyl-CoA synthetase (AMP-forming)/AMP-acid ligase II